MATYTTNYNLKKPADADSYDIADANGNMDIIDGALGTLNNHITDVRNYGNVNACASLDAVKSTLTSLIGSMEDNTKKVAYIRTTASFGLFSNGITYFVELSRYSQNYANANIQQLAGSSFILGMYTSSGWVFEELALNNQLATNTYFMKSGTTAYGVLVRYANVVFFTVFNTTWNSTANTSIISNDANAVQLVVPNGYKPVYNCEIKEAFNNKRITVTSSGDVISNETYSGVSLRFSGCWITSDAMPT